MLRLCACRLPDLTIATGRHFEGLRIWVSVHVPLVGREEEARAFLSLRICVIILSPVILRWWEHPATYEDCPDWLPDSF